MADNDVNITYETLFELLRREKSRAELQKLDKSFFEDVALYLCDKKRIFEEQRSKADLFALTEREKTKKQLENIQRLLKDLYEKREGKIMNIALQKSRVPGLLIDNSVFLEQEKMLFDQLVEIFDVYRKGILYKIADGENPLLCANKNSVPENKVISNNAQNSDEPLNQGEKQENNEPSKKPIDTAELKDTSQKENNNIKIVRFKSPIPCFVGLDLEEYGPYDSDDIANLPEKIASLLVKKGRAEFIEEG